MEFCKNCNGILIPLSEGKLKCKKCDNITEGKIESKEKIREKIKKKDGIVEENGNLFATYEHICKKCGFNKSQIIYREPYITDEDSLLYLKCGKCGFCENLARKIM